MSILNAGAERHIGKVGVVTAEIDNDKGTGRVELEREIWTADNAAWDGDNKIPVGLHVEVVKVEGSHLIVKRR